MAKKTDEAEQAIEGEEAAVDVAAAELNEQIVENMVSEVVADTLRGDMRDNMLAWFKAQPAHWQALTEAQQGNLAYSLDRFCEGLIARVCNIVATAGRPSIRARLVQYAEKDGIEAKIKLASTSEVVAYLHEACGRDVVIVMPATEEFMGERAQAKVDPDQPAIPGIGEEYDEQ